MDGTDPLEVLRDAAGNPALLALATVDMAFPGMSVDERAALREALQAAAVPHWCDAAILAELTEIEDDAAAQLWARLQKLPVVEEFPARGSDTGNVHEASRLAIRRHLASIDLPRLRHLSGRAVRHFATDRRPAGQIEWISHLLVADPEAGADGLARLHVQFQLTANTEDVGALAVAIAELERQGLLQGRARVRARLVMARRRAEVDGTASLGELGRTLLREAEQFAEERLVADSYCLVGDIALDTGNSAEARRAFDQCRALLRRQVDDDPTDVWRRHALAIAHCRVGHAAMARGDLGAARRPLSHGLVIFQELVDRDPGNGGWQRELAVAHARIGEVAFDGGDPTAAERSFGQSLALFQQLLGRDPENSAWQGELAVAQLRVGDVALARGDLDAAERSFAAGLAIFQQLVERDPENARLLRDLSVIHGRVGELAVQRDDREAAERAIRQSLEISHRLADRDPRNAQWTRDLAFAYLRAGFLAQPWEGVAAARRALDRSAVLLQRIVHRDPGNVAWQADLALVRREIDDLPPI